MSSYAKRESFFEKLSSDVVDSETIDAFFEKMANFRAEIRKQEDLIHVYSFRELCASLSIDQLSELKTFRGEVNHRTLGKFFDGLVITPHLMFRLALYAGEQSLKPESKQNGFELAKMLLARLDAFDPFLNDEAHLLTRSLRKLTTVLAGTEFEHAFAEYFLSKPIGGELMHSVVIKSYLALGDREIIEHHTPGDDLTPIDVEPQVAERALKWLRKNESRIVELIVEGGLSSAFNADLAALAQSKGFSSLAWIIRLRQLDYQPDEILRNLVDYGAHPDQRMTELLERKGSTSGIKALLDSNAALTAYCLAQNVDSTVLIDSKNLKVVQRKALIALSSLGLEPHPSRRDAVREIASSLIDSAVDHESVSWLSELKCLDETLKSSRKYQGMRLESDLGM